MKGYKRFIVTSFFWVFLFCSAAFAAPTTSTQAGNVVKGWLKHNPSPFEEITGTFSKVEAYGEKGKVTNPSETLYYAVYLDPSGIVLIPADDELEPITAYAPDATFYGPVPANPLYDSIGAGIAEIVKRHNSGARRSAGASETREKWASLEKLAQEGWNREAFGPALAPQPQIVSPLLKTKWGQEQLISDDFYVYNRYTPNNFPAGCGAVMMAQIMKYFEWPTVPISDLAVKGKTYKFTVNGKSQSWEKLLGGDGEMGPYAWDYMKDDATGITEIQAESIGRLLADAAVVIESAFGADATGSYPDRIADELMTSFGYGNAVLAKSSASPVGQIDSDMMLRAINSNLDAKKPVGLGIYRSSSKGAGHGVVVDGYGYSSGSIYHHVNLGWGGSVHDPKQDLWYNLPLVLDYDLVDSMIYNIYTVKPYTGTEIISGRVVTSTDVPAAEAIVTITGPNIRDNLITDNSGRFVFTGIPSNTTVTISATLGGHSFPITQVTTGESCSPAPHNNYTSSVGNVWDVVIQEDKAGSQGCGAASFPAVFAIVAAGAVLLKRKKR